MDHRLVLTLFFIFSFSFIGLSQNEMPELKTNTAVISIKEGSYLHKDCWTISPEIEWDEYVTNPFAGEKTVTFVSDVDTLEFSVVPNKQYDFVVVLNGKRAYTRMSTDASKSPSNPFLEYTHDDKNRVALVDTIPFRLGDNHGIYISGNINGSEALDLLFDTGANALVISSRLVGEKVTMTMDGQQENNGSDGNHTVETSSGNKLEVGQLNWENVSLLSIDYSYLNGVVGWVVFENKIVEINYDLNLLLIHRSMETVPTGYTKIETKMINNIPYVWGTLIVGNKTCSNWMEYDTGSNGNLLLSRKFARANRLHKSLEFTGISHFSGSAGVSIKSKNYILPKIQLGGFETALVPITIKGKDPHGSSESNNILGNSLLKRFNTVIDFQSFTIYLKPNSLFYNAY